MGADAATAGSFKPNVADRGQGCFAAAIDCNVRNDTAPQQSNPAAAQQPPQEGRARSWAQPIIVSEPTFSHDNVTVGTYPDPTSIFTRDVVQQAPRR